jgi:acyl-CoA dehydrogenase
MAVIRWHLARKGLGLFNDLQNESSIVGNLNAPQMMRDFATPAQMQKYMPGLMVRYYDRIFYFGLSNLTNALLTAERHDAHSLRLDS